MAVARDCLDEVLAAVQTGSVVAQPASIPTLHLVARATMSPADAPVIREFLRRVNDEMEIDLAVVGGGFGCTRLILAVVDVQDPNVAERLLSELLASDVVASMAVEIGFNEMYRAQPYAHRNLATGITQGEIPNDGLVAFVSYAREDEVHRLALTKHLAALRRQNLLRAWTDREIPSGADWRAHVEQQINSAHLVLILLSADYFASDICNEVELPRALARRNQGLASIVPIIVKPVDWEETVFGDLNAVPTGGIPITKWSDPEEAWTDVAKHIRRMVRQLR